MSILLKKLPKRPLFYQINSFFGFNQDIQNTIINNFWQNKEQTKLIAPYFLGKNLESTLYNIFEFVRNNITYKEDLNGFQDVKSPYALLESGFGDCKSFSILIASILYNLQIPFCFRFVSYDKNDQTPTHVYIKVGFYTIDATINKFNYEIPFFYKIDKCFMTTKISSINKPVGIVPLPSQTGGAGFNWGGLAQSVLQILPGVINPQSQNYYQQQQILQQQQQNLQALAQAQNQFQQNNPAFQAQQNQGFSIQSLLSNPVVLLGLAFLGKELLAKKNK